MAMLSYIVRRVLYAILLLAVLSVVIFSIIQLPPGDYAETRINALRLQGQIVDDAMIFSIRAQYGLDVPVYVQYLRWASGFLTGNLGQSFYWNQPITTLLKERLPITIFISIVALLFTYVVSVPIGIFSATHKYSVFDYIFTVIGFIGVAIPGFLFALILLYVMYEWFGISAGGLFSREFMSAGWSWAKVFDMLKKLWTPVLVLGLSGTCWLIRVMRATMLDELGKPYVETARAKGLKESTMLFRYPVRVAINPILSTVGWTLPGIFSGEAIVSIVLMLPTIGPLMLQSLMAQDFYVAGSLLMITSALTIIGTLISDILLAWADPRIRFE